MFDSCSRAHYIINHQWLLAKLVHTSTGEHSSSEDIDSVRKNSSYVSGSPESCFYQKDNQTL